MKEMSRHLEKILYQFNGDAYFEQKRAELMGSGYTILEIFGDSMRFTKKLLESVSISQERSTFYGDEALKVGLNGTHWNFDFQHGDFEPV